MTEPQRVTERQMKDRIDSVEFYVLPDTTVTICHLTLTNGYSVRGESACVDPAAFDAELGREVAFNHAFGKLWPLFGFLLAEQRHNGTVPATPKPPSLYDIARVAHEVNRAYQTAIGEEPAPPWHDAPQWQHDATYAGVRYLLDTAGADVSALHEHWREHKAAEGWVYGKSKDPEARTHPCMVPFHHLPDEHKAKDYLFAAVVSAMNEVTQ